MTDTHDDITLEPEEDGAEEKADSRIKKLRDELKKAKSEAAEYLAGWQRSKADYVNLSRRVREQEESHMNDGVARMAKSVIAVFDSLEAARISAEKAEGAVYDGIEQVIKQLEAALKEHGIVRFAPDSGAPFDPSRHEPVLTVATEREMDDNTVLETHQSGYEIGSTVIRPARVSVTHYQKKS